MSGAGGDRPRVGFIGLGRMGAPMARRPVEAGYPLTIWNRTRDKSEDFARQTSCEVSASPGEVAQRSDVVITMVADGDALRSVYFDDPAFVAELAGGTAIDMSTVGPEAARENSRRLAAGGVRFLEAPVSGSTQAAEAGTLTIMVGGSEADLDPVRPLLEAMGDPVLRLGDVGAAAVMKLVINSLIFGINQCLAEGVILAERSGIDRAAAYDAVLASAAAAPVVRYRRGAFLDPEQEPVSFALRLGAKDLDLALSLADRTGVPLHQAELNRSVLAEAIEAGFGERDIAAVAEYLRERTG